MKITFSEKVKVVQPDDTIVERVMNVDGTFYDCDPHLMDVSEASMEDFFDAMQQSGDLDDPDPMG